MDILLVSLLSELLSHILIAIELFVHTSEASLCDSHLYEVKLLVELSLFTATWGFFVCGSSMSGQK